MTVALHSVYTRGSHVVMTTLTCLAAAALGMALSSIALDLLVPPSPSADIRVTTSDLVNIRMPDNTGEKHRIIDRVVLFMNGTVDLRSCFDWNTRQLYVMFIAQYATREYPRNEVTLLDMVVPSKAEGLVTLKEPSAKYPLDDITYSSLVANPSVRVVVRYHEMKSSGWSPIRDVPADKGGVIEVPMPAHYRGGAR